MREAEQYLLRVLRGFVQGEDPGPFSGDWRQLLELAGIHSVTGILGHSVMSWPHADSEPYAQDLRRECLRTMQIFSRRGEAMAKLVQALADAVEQAHAVIRFQLLYGQAHGGLRHVQRLRRLGGVAARRTHGAEDHHVPKGHGSPSLYRFIYRSD